MSETRLANIRKPIKLAPDQSKLEQNTRWHTLQCELVTPMYGGGVESTKVDEKMPIRVTSIRGQLRFWWRLLAKQKWYKGKSNTDIRKLEFALWGGMNDGEEGGQASKVSLKVTDVPSEKVINNHLVSYEKFPKLRYVLFPAYKETNPNLQPHKLLLPRKSGQDISWQLHFAFEPSASEEQKQQVVDTLQWWANFGGLGFRTRRGLGAIYISECESYPKICEILAPKDVEEFDCKLVQKSETSSDSLKVLETTISRLADFRQKAGIGRNPGQEANRPGRSRWPEPDALRRIYRKHADLHEPTHPARNIFPRALFGLPIIFDFGPSAGKGDPHQKTMLQSTKGERYASPLILRPTYAGTNQKGEKLWQASALLLPYERLKSMEVEIDDKHYPIWKAGTAKHIQPIRDNPQNGDNNTGEDNNDPLQAFLIYFAK